jgi:large subunit ribosomal protein L21
MYAVFSSSGTQIKAEPGRRIRVAFMRDQKEGDKVSFDRVLLVSDGADTRVGTPFVGAKVLGTVVAHGRTKKVIVFKKKRRVDYHKRHGHRQHFTTVLVDSIEG